MCHKLAKSQPLEGSNLQSILQLAFGFVSMLLKATLRQCCVHKPQQAQLKVGSRCRIDGFSVQTHRRPSVFCMTKTLDRFMASQEQSLITGIFGIHCIYGLPFLWAQKRMPLPLWRLRVTVAKSKAWYEVVLVKSCEGSPRPHDHSSLIDEESVSPPNSLKIESQQIQISGGTGNNRKESIFGEGDAWRIGARPGTTEFRR